ncbi:hypothetical protein [Priestia endophytica]|jgi:hypothetical protein|uniref:Uncharacterized protein n=2 Tax=Priestia endophytica TaxID=135735 RepID=A0AAX1Q798_9BACI|nr:hypothetical protein [Priestia endophytica]RAS76019.1 hypothetical protein A3864_14140 [Priestia endophytica]RAS92224.1 hypothetical protein A3863_03010 [Priestia endophytica]
MKANICICILLTVATALGIFGQDMAYFLEGVIGINALYCLTFTTIVTVLLYIVTGICLYIFTRKSKISKKGIEIYWTGIIGISIVLSFWSIFVLAMWWG